MPTTRYDWLTFGLITLAAILCPLDDIRKRLVGEGVQEMTSPLWSYLPVALIGVAAILMIFRALGWLGGEYRFAWQKKQNPKLVSGKRFVNEAITLDGFHYTGCRFENVTFHFNGITAPTITNSQIGGRTRFKSENPAIESTLIFLWCFRKLTPDFELVLTPEERERFKQMELPPEPNRQGRRGGKRRGRR